MATTAYFHGQALRLYSVTATDTPALADVADANAFACAKSATLSTSKATIDVTCLGQEKFDTTPGLVDGTAGHRDLIAGLESWSCSTENLYVLDDTAQDAVDIQTLYAAGAPVTVIFGDGTSNNYWYGRAIITSLEFSAAPGEVASFNVSFEGTGALSYGALS